MNPAKIELRRDIVSILDREIPTRINKLKSGEIERKFFYEVAFAIAIYGYFRYHLSAELHERILTKGLERTYLNFEEVDKAIIRGKEKARFILSIYEGGRELINKLAGIRENLH